MKALRLPPMTPQQRRLAIGIAVGVAFLMWWLGVGAPQWRAIRVTGPKARALYQDLRQARHDLANIQALKRQHEALRATLGAQPGVLAQERLPSLVDDLAVLAKAHAISIDTMNPIAADASATSTPAKAKKGEAAPAASAAPEYLVIPIEIRGRAGYHEMGEFLEALEQAPQLYQVQSLAIEGDRRDARRHQVKLVVKAYLAVTAL